MSIFQNTCKPDGFWGKLMVKGMNGSSHARLAKWGFSFLPTFPEKSNILDAGCGGGANVKRWLTHCPNGMVYGIDYSEVSVQESMRVNREAIQSGRCQIKQADVAELAFEKDSFACVSAFETVYFWPSLQDTFRKIHDILCLGGLFLICNESDGHDPTAIKFAKIIEGMHLYDRQALTFFLQEAGFRNIEVYEATGRPWLCILAEKER